MTTQPDAPPRSRQGCERAEPKQRIGPRAVCPWCDHTQHGVELVSGQMWCRCERGACRRTFYAFAVEDGEVIPTLHSPFALHGATRVVSVLAYPADRTMLRGRPVAEVLPALGYPMTLHRRIP